MGAPHKTRKNARKAALRPVPASGESTAPQSGAQVRGDALQSALGKIQGLETEIADVIRGVQEKVLQLELLNEFSGILNSTLDTASVREKALEATCKLVSCETGSLLLVDGKTGELYWETALGVTGQELKKGFRLPINDRSIAGYVAMTGEPLLINDVESDPRYFKKVQEKTAFRTKTMLCVPLRAKDQVVGVLQAINKLPNTLYRNSLHEWPDFQPDDLKLLITLSHQVAIAIDNSRLYQDLKKSFYDTVEALAEAIEKKDRYTGGHTKRVVLYSMIIGRSLNLNPEQLERIRLGALLHDVGKIGVEDKVLKKDAPLDPAEWKVMQKHPNLGYDIMNRVESLKDVMGGMRFHHERWDGKGYPIGLKGEEIPLIARIIAVADTYDAMVSTRPYRKGLPAKMAYDEIIRYRGTQFDPLVVDAFVSAFDEGLFTKGGAAQDETKLSNCD